MEQLTIKIEKDDLELVKKASKIKGIGHTTFLRIIALEKARQILRKNKEEAIAQ